jgi:RNA polymerase sigma-70 factor (ECF subfamily)
VREFFDELYAAHAEEIKKYIFTIARRDSEITGDIFQVTWENAFRYMNSLRDVSAARAWLYSIARNEAKRYFSSGQVKMFADYVSIYDDPEFDASAPVLAYEPAEEFPDAFADSELLTELLDKLSYEEQQIILLHYYYGLGLREITRLYNANYNSIKSIKRRAINKLRHFAGASEV